MIAYLRGRILEKHPNRVIVDVNGVGYDVAVPLSTFYGLSDADGDVTLRIHTHVREDALSLYGFCLLYTSPSPRDRQKSRMPSSA